MSLLYKLKNILKTDDHLSPVEKKINYLFHNREYLVQAFTHKSITPSPRKNYERLEFLGNTVIDLIESRKILEDLSQSNLVSYRAPGFSLTKNQKQIYNILIEKNYKNLLKT